MRPVRTLFALPVVTLATCPAALAGIELQRYFIERRMTSTADQPDTVHAADLDGDGDLDVMSASFFDDTIAWYENIGPRENETASQFVTHIVSDQEMSAYSVYAADINGDGRMDMLSASADDDTVAWWENDGATPPNFEKRVISTNADFAYAVFAADLDGDGDQDVLSASRIDDKVAWYENDGAATPGFTERVLTTDADNARQVQAADMDADGDMDILVASSNDNTVAWWENDGSADPTFTRRVVTTGATGTYDVAAGDLDGDGDLDLLVCATDDNRIVWFESDGAPDPSFTERDVDRRAFTVLSAAPVDVDGDGDMDIAAAIFDEASIVWYENDGEADPTFERRRVTIAAGGAFDVIGADLDADGDQDLVGAASGDFKVAWWRNMGPDDPQPFPERLVTAGLDGAFDVTAADLDGDGDTDLATASRFDNRVAWHENVAERNEAPDFALRTLTMDAAGVVDVEIADVNGDGLLDILSASVLDSTVRLFERRGGPDALFVERVVSDEVPAALATKAADVNGDGLTDVLSVAFDEGRIYWHRNEGETPISFEQKVAVEEPLLGTFVDFAAGDLDGDGDVDILTALRGLLPPRVDRLVWYENDGDAEEPTFARRWITAEAEGAREFRITDIDEDGNLDFVVALAGRNQVVLYRNDGSALPVFRKKVVSDIAYGAWSVDTADIDGDGDVDIVSGSADDNKIAWHMNTGERPLRFEERFTFGFAAGARAVWSADVNGDGRTDILSASQDDDAIRWYSNVVRRACPADLNGDGVVGGADLSILLGFWEAQCGGDCAADLNFDQTVDAIDLAGLLGQWGACAD